MPGMPALYTWVRTGARMVPHNGKRAIVRRARGRGAVRRKSAERGGEGRTEAARTRGAAAAVEAAAKAAYMARRHARARYNAEFAEVQTALFDAVDSIPRDERRDLLFPRLSSLQAMNGLWAIREALDLVWEPDELGRLFR